MTLRPPPWRRRAPSLLLAVLLHALIIVAFLRGLALVSPSLRESALQVSIVAPPASKAPLPPTLHAPPLGHTPPIPPLIPPTAWLPTLPAAPAPVVSAPKIVMRPRPAPVTSGDTAEMPPQFVSGPLDANELYPESARLSFSQGEVWTRVCVYSTGEIASVALLRSSGDRELDAAALATALLRGKPVARCRPFRIDFTLTQPALD